MADSLSALTGQPVAADWESIQAAQQAMAANAQQAMEWMKRQSES